MCQGAGPLEITFAPLDHAEPVHVLGDSNALSYRFQTISAPASFARPFVTAAQYFPNFSAASAFADGRVHPDLDAYLRDVIFSRDVLARKERQGLGPDLVRLQVSRGRELFGWDELNFQDDPVVVLVLGALDVAWILGQLGPGVEFHLDDARFDETRFESSSRSRVPFDAVVRLCRARVAPLERALGEIVERGFDRVYLRNVHPPTLDDIAYFRMRRVLTTAAQRYKTTILVNRILREIAETAGVRFLDTWDQTTTGGSVRAEMIFDADHLNRNAAEIAIRTLLSDLIVRRSAPLAAPDRFDLE